jgi:replicative DNA helicase
VWGEGEEVAWPSGEALILYGPPGVGKSTLAQQLALSRIGVGAGCVLGFPVRSSERPLLYVAADRPRQVMRSLRRMVGDNDADVLASQLIVRRGPLPFQLADDPTLLAALAVHLEVGTVVLDSLKDLGAVLSSDEGGMLVNAAIQHTLASGVEVLALHHPRKAQADNRKPNRLDDMYGSQWLASGAGSVICLWGNPGDPVVEFLHLKQPAETIPPFRVFHDHRSGTSQAMDAVDLEALLVSAGEEGVTAKAAALALFSSDDRASVEKTRRRLDKLVERGKAHRIRSQDGVGADAWQAAGSAS